MFKARPAKVLHMKPFEPKKEERPLVEITQFELNTERRAKEREMFELKLKKEEEEVAKCRQMVKKMMIDVLLCIFLWCLGRGTKKTTGTRRNSENSKRSRAQSATNSSL